MGNIVLLDDLTINKIAAGEVIERPASVVKEVVENSIDAGADNISVEIKNGGISYIRITDNGKGIQADDMEIAFERHATSKIRKAEDIENVTSMGFRGEALASIAAIARVELVSKTENSDVGYKIVVEGGKILSKEEIGCPKGTSITIENLFYNTPVRYKFLKKDFTESGYIEDAITRIALVNPNIAIKYINSGKTVIQTSGNGEIKDVVYGIYGKDVAENIINVEYYFEDMAVKGVIGKPSIARSNRANQLFFVNKRYVKDKTLTSSAEQAFKGTLPIGKYGFLILNVEIDPHKLDVNVHPAKLEVRFQEENKVFKLVYHAIKEALLKGNDIGDSNTMIGDSFKNNYIEDTSKNEDKSNENKGIGGFFKNMKNKNDFGTNEFNLVEELYNDKIKHENNEIRNEVAESANTGVDYKFSSISNTDSLKDDVKLGFEDSVKTEAENYDNIIVKPDGGIELKNEFHNLGNRDFENHDLENKSVSDETKIFDSSLNFLNTKNTSVSDETLVNFNWTEGKIEALKEQINALTNNTTSSNTNGSQENNKDKESVEKLIASFNKVEEKVEEKEEVAVEKPEEKVEVAVEKVDNIEENAKNENLNIENTEPKNDVKQENSEEKDKQKNGENASATDFEEMYAKMFGTTISKSKADDNKVEEDKGGYKLTESELKTVQNMSLFNNKSMFSGPVYKFIGIVFDSNIIIEYENEMYIIDQHVANERILYEKIKKNYYSDSEKDSQLMLLPDIIELSHKQMGIAKDNLNLFKKAGFDLEVFGENTIKLTGVPSICIDLDTRQLFLDILEEVNTVARTAAKEIEEKFIQTIAAKTAETASIALTEAEVNTLMQNLLTLQNPFTCPDGKQAAIKMSKADIEKKFSRR